MVCQRGVSLLSVWFVTVENSPHQLKEWSVAFLLGKLLTLIFVLFPKNLTDRPPKRLPPSHLTFTATTNGVSGHQSVLHSHAFSDFSNSSKCPVVPPCFKLQMSSVTNCADHHSGSLSSSFLCWGVTSDLLAICKAGFALFCHTPSL